MTIVLYVLLAVVVLIPLYAIILYNRLVTSRNMVEEGWSGIEVQLKRRANLIPNLVETVKGYAAHEKGVLEEVTRARAAATSATGIDAAGKAENVLTSALRQLFAVAEAYPDLKADENFQQLQSQLAEVEDDIQKSRRYYNGAVRRLNTMIELFPSNIVAAQFRFQQADYFEIEDPASREVPTVDFG
ncbi:MAG: LemA family protein [Paracoccaceae bacterium]